MSALMQIWLDTSAVFASTGYAFFTVQANLVCIVILAILLYRQQDSSDQTEAGIIWVRLIFLQILCCLSRIFRVLDDVSLLPGNTVSHFSFAALNMLLFSLMCWMVFVHNELYQKSKLLDSFPVKVLVFLPCLINTIMILISPFTGFYFGISGENITRGVLYPLMMVLSAGYPAASVIIAILRRRRMTRYERDAASLAAVYPAVFAIFGPLQALNWKMPLLCYVIVIADIFVNLSYSDSLILTDHLTKIPNKNGLMQHLAERLGQENPEGLHVFAVDIDALGGINSSHGRLEGDHALVLVAEALQKFRSNEHDCYISRYLGDEFILTADIWDNEERDLFIEHIRNYVSNAAMSEKLAYHLRVSIGWSKYEQFSKTETISGLIEEADRSLLENREQKRFQSMWQGSASQE